MGLDDLKVSVGLMINCSMLVILRFYGPTFEGFPAPAPWQEHLACLSLNTSKSKERKREERTRDHIARRPFDFFSQLEKVLSRVHSAEEKDEKGVSAS